MKNVIKVSTFTNDTAWLTADSSVVSEMIKLMSEGENTKGVKSWEVGKVPFEELPAETQVKIKNVLKAFDKCNVIMDWNITKRETEFNVSASVSIKANYSIFEAVCGCYKAEDIFTAEERRENYFESFGEYPHYAMKSNIESLN